MSKAVAVLVLLILGLCPLNGYSQNFMFRDLEISCDNLVNSVKNKTYLIIKITSPAKHNIKVTLKDCKSKVALYQKYKLAAGKTLNIMHIVKNVYYSPYYTIEIKLSGKIFSNNIIIEYPTPPKSDSPNIQLPGVPLISNK